MLRITVEMLPFGDEKRAKVIATARVSLQAKGATVNKGNYTYDLSYQSHKHNQPGQWHMWKDGIIKQFPRGRRNVWYLLRDVLKDALGEQ